MRIASLETTIVSVPYRHREVSSRVQRDGVTDVVVKLTTDDGLVGWGESCSGANVESVAEALQAARPFVIGRDPWQTEAIAHDFFIRGRIRTLDEIKNAIDEVSVDRVNAYLKKNKPGPFTIFILQPRDMRGPLAGRRSCSIFQLRQPVRHFHLR